MRAAVRTRTWGVTQHAVERFIERHAPGLSFAEAKARLLTGLVDARPLRTRTRRGDPRWLVPDLEVVAVVKEEGHRVVVTVEPPGPEDLLTEAEYAELVDAAVRLPGVRFGDLRRAPVGVREDLLEAARARPTPVVEPDASPAPTATPKVELAPRPASPPPAVRLEQARAKERAHEARLAELRLAEVREREKTERMRLHEAWNNERLKEGLRVALVALDASTRALAQIREVLGAEHVDAMLEVAARRAREAGEG